MKVEELTTFIVKRLADKADVAAVKTSQDGDMTVLSVQVDETDKGKIIGKQGKVIKAIRALVGVAAAKTNARVVVEVD